MVSPRRQRQGSRVMEDSRACTEPCRTSVLIVMDNLGGVADSVEAGKLITWRYRDCSPNYIPSNDWSHSHYSQGFLEEVF